MSKAVHELSNGLTINAENPTTHSHPEYCVECECFYYFNHICTKHFQTRKTPHEAFKLGQIGYFNGEDNEKN